MKTDVAKSVLLVARRVLENVKAGRVYSPREIEWAEDIVKANTPSDHSRETQATTRARAGFAERAS